MPQGKNMTLLKIKQDRMILKVLKITTIIMSNKKMINY
jgi:hypothetical protein